MKLTVLNAKTKSEATHNLTRALLSSEDKTLPQHHHLPLFPDSLSNHTEEYQKLLIENKHDSPCYQARRFSTEDLSTNDI